MMKDLPHLPIAVGCFGLAAALGVIWLLSGPSTPSPQTIVAPCSPNKLPSATDTLTPNAYCFELSDDAARLTFRVHFSYVDMEPVNVPLRVYLYDNGQQPRRTFDIPEGRCTSLGFARLAQTQYGLPSIPAPGYSKIEARAASRTFVKVRVRRVGDDSVFCQFQ